MNVVIILSNIYTQRLFVQAPLELKHLCSPEPEA